MIKLKKWQNYIKFNENFWFQQFIYYVKTLDSELKIDVEVLILFFNFKNKIKPEIILFFKVK